jgi:hypothetical protein
VLLSAAATFRHRPWGCFSPEGCFAS